MPSTLPIIWVGTGYSRLDAGLHHCRCWQEYGDRETINIAIAFERKGTGRAVVDSSFHHFVDYNLDPSTGCPSFVTEPCSYRTPWIQPNVLFAAGLQKDSAVIGIHHDDRVFSDFNDGFKQCSRRANGTPHR